MAIPDPSLDIAVELISTAEKILNCLVAAPDLALNDPMTYLALQLLGPVLARAIGDDPRRSTENLIAIAEQLDVTLLRHILKV